LHGVADGKLSFCGVSGSEGVGDGEQRFLCCCTAYVMSVSTRLGDMTLQSAIVAMAQRSGEKYSVVQ